MKTRRSLLIGVITVSLLSIYLLSSEDAKLSPQYFVYVTLSGTDSVLEIGSDNQAIGRTLNAKSDPMDIAISTATHTAYIVGNWCISQLSENGTVNVVDLQTKETVAIIRVGRCPQKIALSPDGQRVYVTHGSIVSVIDTTSNIVIDTIDVGVNAYASNVAVNSTGSRVYILVRPAFAPAQGWVEVIDLASGNRIETIMVGAYPNEAVLSSDDTKLYVTNFWDGTMSVIDTTSNSVAETVDTGCRPTSMYVACQTTGIVLSNDGSRIYIGMYTEGTIRVFDSQSYDLIATVPVGTGVQELALSPDDASLYVTVRDLRAISIIDTKTNRVTKNISLDNPSAGPIGLAIWNPPIAPPSSTLELRPTEFISTDLPSTPIPVVETSLPTLEPAVTVTPDAAQNLADLIDTLYRMPNDLFSSTEHQLTLTDLMQDISNFIVSGHLDSASSTLENDILVRSDGCASLGQPDENDWIMTCGNGIIDFENPDGQEELYSLIVDLIQNLQMP